MGRRRSDQSAMSPAFNPHPSVRRGAIVRLFQWYNSPRPFNPHPPVRRGAIWDALSSVWTSTSFQSSPPREEGCYSATCSKLQ